MVLLAELREVEQGSGLRLCLNDCPHKIVERLVIRLDELRVDLPVWWEAGSELILHQDEVLVEPVKGTEELSAITLHLDVLLVKACLCRIADGFHHFGPVMLNLPRLCFPGLEAGGHLLVLLLDQPNGNRLLVLQSFELGNLCYLDGYSRMSRASNLDQTARQVGIVLVKGF